MSGIDIALNFASRSNFFTWVIMIWLSIYFIITFGILFGRYMYLTHWLSIEKHSLESMLMGARNVGERSILRKCSNTAGNCSEKLLNVCKNVAEKNATGGLWMLSIIASTAPFIGLFGTVVSILETFSGLGQSGSASLGVIAPAISEALVATAAGIFVAIPAYSANLFLRRKAYEVIVYVQREVDILLSASEQKSEM